MNDPFVEEDKQPYDNRADYKFLGVHKSPPFRLCDSVANATHRPE